MPTMQIRRLSCLGSMIRHIIRNKCLLAGRSNNNHSSSRNRCSRRKHSSYAAPSRRPARPANQRPGRSSKCRPHRKAHLPNTFRPRARNMTMGTMTATTIMMTAIRIVVTLTTATRMIMMTVTVIAVATGAGAVGAIAATTTMVMTTATTMNTMAATRSRQRLGHGSEYWHSSPFLSAWRGFSASSSPVFRLASPLLRWPC